MSSDQSTSRSLEACYRRLFAVPEEALRAEARGFVQWLFDDAVIRPYTIELLRRDRVDSEHFIDHQCDLFIRLAALLQRFLAVYPHEMMEGAFVCGNGVCQEHLRLLDQLLRTPKAVDGDWLAAGTTPDQTPLSLAIHHLNVSERQHAGLVGSQAADRLKLDLNDLSVQHGVAFRHRADRLKVSSARALRELIRWTRVGETQVGDFSMSAEAIWAHLRRVHLDLQSIVSAAQDLDSILTAFRIRSEGHDATRLRQLASSGSLQQVPRSRLTTEIVRYLQDHSVPAWPSGSADQLSALHDAGTVIVDAMAYSATKPEPLIQAAVRHLQALMQPLAAKGHTCQALFVLFRFGGSVCEVPPRLDFNHFAIRLELVDLVRPAGEHTGRSGIPLEITADELMDEEDPTPTSGTPISTRESARAVTSIRRSHVGPLLRDGRSGRSAPLGWVDTVWTRRKAAEAQSVLLFPRRA